MREQTQSRLTTHTAIGEMMLTTTSASPIRVGKIRKTSAGQLSDIKTLSTIRDTFVNELKRGSEGKKCSLPFINHELSSKPLVLKNDVFQIMVIGGSVFKEALVKNGKGGFIFLRKKQEALPVFKTKRDLLLLVERHLDPAVKVVSINFAYPLIPVLEDGKLDGTLLMGTKEHIFSGLVGKKVGKELENYIYQKNGRRVKFSLANDTVCLLLSGLEKASWVELAGGVVGTGVNFAFFTGPKSLVNLESGNFNAYPTSKEAQEIDNTSLAPGKGIFEKETAGGYLYQHFNSIVKKTHAPYPLLTSTLELKKLAMNSKSKQSQIALELIKKSAALISAQIAGITLFKRRNMAFVMEGSFFWESGIYKECVEEYLEELAEDFKVSFITINDSPYFGAARLVC